MWETIKRLVMPGDAPVASHPARLDASVLRVAASYPLWPVLLAVGWVVALAAVLDGFHWAALALLALATYGNYAYWSSIRGWFQRGDACPGAIVSESPLLVATFTDLGAAGVPYPAVKIRREPAKRFPGDALKAGRPVVSVARYDGTIGADHWTNFHPRLVQCATADDEQVKRLLKEVPRDQWEALQAAIRRLPKPYRPGLYRLTGDP